VVDGPDPITIAIDGVIVLAGDRGAQDPVASSRDVPAKALVPVAGRPMLVRVLDTLSGLDPSVQLVLVAPQTAAFRSVVAETVFPAERIRWIAPAPSPSRSLVSAFEALPDAPQVMLVTADHPLLELDWLRQLSSGARDQDAELAVGLVQWSHVQARFPGSRRTKYPFRDIAVCGTNLFLFRSHRSRTVAALWQQVEADRKRPWRIVSLIGMWNLLRFLGGRLSLSAALDALSRRVGFRVRAVLLDAPESAVDVDSVADLVSVEHVLHRRAAHAED
jgi:CTP:molybdopterin cytidylyltransferase MocA